MVAPAAPGRPARLRTLLEVLAAHPEGLDGPSLLQALRERWPHLTEARVRQLLAEAGPAVTETAGVYRAPRPPGPNTAPVPSGTGPDPGRPRPLRAVAVDIEALPRLVAQPPYVERALWQVGAARFGGDEAWAGHGARRAWWVEVPEGFGLVDPERAAAHTEKAEPPERALAELAGFCAGADVVVAYNGTELDFGELDRAFAATGVPPLGSRRVDGLYLAYCLWPWASSHRLRDLAKEVGADVSGLSWHDAADDAEMLARLLTYGARSVVARWGPELAGLVSAVAASSDA